MSRVFALQALCTVEHGRGVSRVYCMFHFLILFTVFFLRAIDCIYLRSAYFREGLPTEGERWVECGHQSAQECSDAVR